MVLTLLAFLLLVQASAPRSSLALSIACLTIVGAVAVGSPRHGLYLIVFFSLVGDGQFLPWFPFVRNLSSASSVLYVHDAVWLSPLELSLVGLFVVVTGRHLLGRPVQLRGGSLLRPMLVFVGLAGVSLVYGIARGGNTNVALWEVRPLAYLLLVYVACSILLTSRDQYRNLLVVACAALAVEGLSTALLINFSSDPRIEAMANLGYLEHSASLHLNVAFVWLAAMRAFGTRERGIGRAVLLWGLPGITVTYFLAERRSAMAGLGVAILLLGVALYKRRRGVFWVVAPLVVVFGAAFVAGTWNIEGSLGLPATVVKGVVAPEQLSEADASSNLYRVIETYNLVETVRARPILGSGFGHEFIKFIPLPYLAFAWADYFPHNSVLWIWINMGIAGMLSMLVLTGMAIRDGAAAVLSLPPREAAMTFVATAFVAMYLVYAYVDIAWDSQSMVLLGFFMAMIAHLPGLVPVDD